MSRLEGTRPDGPRRRERRRRILRRVTAQHLRLDEMTDAVVRAIEEADLPTARASLVHFAEALCAHFSMEDDVDFPALGAVHPGLVERLRELSADHVRLLEDLAAVAETLTESARAEAHRAFDRLVVDLGSHEVREERLLDRLSSS